MREKLQTAASMIPVFLSFFCTNQQYVVGIIVGDRAPSNQAIIKVNAGSLLVGTMGTYSSEIPLP